MVAKDVQRNVGSIVVIGTFLSNIFPTDRQGTLTVPLYIKILMGLAFVGFGASLLLSTYVLILYRWMLEGRAFRDVIIGTDRESVWLIVRSDEPIPGRSREEERRSVVKELIARERRGRRLDDLPLVFFTGGLICFGTAVLFNLFFGS
jgi:hypothetical protein